MKSTALLLVVICGFMAFAYSQENAAALANVSLPIDVSGKLKVKSTKVVQFSGSFLIKFKCDGAGNVYLHLIDSETIKEYGEYSKSPIFRVKPDGRLGGTFKISKVSPDLWASGFFVTRGGRLFQAVNSDSDSSLYIVSYENNGLFNSKIKLDKAVPRYLVPYQIVAFRSGEFLVSGIKGHTPFTAVFEHDGRLIKKIEEPEDDYSRQRAEAGDRDFTFGAGYGNTSVSHGDAVLGSDDNAYLLRTTSPALIYAISSRGEVVRKLRIHSPSGLTPKLLQTAGSKLAISFLADNSAQGVLKMVDFDGNELAHYISDEKETSPGVLSCYDSSAFTFVTADEERVVRLHKAEPEQ